LPQGSEQSESRVPAPHARLSLHSCDLTQEGAFDEAFAGCQGVVHAAADPDLSLERRASEYPETTAFIVGSIKKAPSVSRVVFTSSVAALAGDADLEEFRARPVISEDRSCSLENLNGYSLGKIRSEALIIEAARESGGRWDVLITNPTDNLGPVLAEHHAQEREAWTPWQCIVARILEGRDFPQTFDWRPWWIVDVRDTALAHIRLLESASARDGSRYLVYSGESIWVEELGGRLTELLPGTDLDPSAAPVELSSPECAQRAREIWSGCTLSNDRIRQEVGLSFRPLHETLRDCALSLVAVAGVTLRKRS